MSKIRKGSIVWDIKRKEFTKVLNSITKGELPDKAVKNTGNICHRIMKNRLALCKDEESVHKYNNASCYMVHICNLIPRKEYLESINQNKQS